MSFLSLRGITKHYPGTEKPAVARFDLDIEKGEFISLLGPSGCGKTTTLRMLAGLVEPTSGDIEVDGKNLTRSPVHKRDMGMVFQSYALFPHLDVKQNVAFGLEMRKVGKTETRQRVEEVLDLVHLGHLGDRRTKALSGGQQQRVALARALVIRPKVLLLDEPLSNLDAKLRENMRDEIRSIQQKTGITTVFVTHDQDEALATSDRIVVMSEGNIEQIGAPRDIYEHPSSRFVATFIGRANLLEGDVIQSDDDHSVVDIAGIGRMPAMNEFRAVGRVTVLVRPHRIRLGVGPSGPGSDRPSIRGVVLTFSYVGDVVEYSVSAAGQTLSVQSLATSAGPVASGEEVRLSWDVEDAVVLRPDDTNASAARSAAPSAGHPGRPALSEEFDAARQTMKFVS
ncbi:ABC transporter ATP-binding protein [Flexivirga alba]|uniref:Spermidine/putrescine import ATP-binding protein PotA n=1 Tax=Flexivirga alba TaxID=702742 RepID=A0ABW2AJ60_9MICO